MAKIKPFKALTFNQELVKNYSKVICPPYDIISASQQERYLNSDPHNLIHILLSKDVEGEDKYIHAGNLFREWIKEKILIDEQKEAIYFYIQQYHIKGETRTRLGFISLLRLPEQDSKVYAHENTRLAPKEDRFKLMKQVKANLSPIFAVFLDKQRIIQRVLRQYIQNKEPFIEAVDNEKTIHRLWRLDTPEVISMIQKSMSQEDIFIADGHHRYEVACAYRDEMKKKSKNFTGEEDFNYLLTYFTNTDTHGLCILPIHRLLKLEPGFDFKKFLVEAAEYFDVEEVKDKTRFFFLMQKGGRNEHLLGMYKDKKYYFLRLKNIKILDKMIADKSKDYRALDVAILNYIVFKKILGYNLENIDNIIYGADAEEFIKEADGNPLNIAFFLNPVQIQQIIAVALHEERMPPKSTYFYPKVISGLVMNKLGENK